MQYNQPSDSSSSGSQPAARRFARLYLLIGLCAALAAALAMPSCLPDGDEPARASAKRITSRDELIGGPTALGEIGDFILMNDKIKVVVEDVGFASGSGLFGGSLIDADRIRTTSSPDQIGGSGKDTFGEFFPAFFLEMVDPEEVVVLNDGSDGKAAIVEVRGRGGEFVSMLRFINQAMINSYEANFGDLVAGIPANSDGAPLVRFSVRYILEPGASHIRVESTLKNASDQPLTFPNAAVMGVLESFLGLDLSGFSVPVGAVLGFGELNSLFLPGVGYDLRWGLEDSYRHEIPLPAFPGLVTDFMASSNTKGTNYGFIAEEAPERNFVANKEAYGARDDDDMLVLFYAAGFSGAFTHDIPDTMGVGEEFTFTNYLIVGTGDVASILDEAYIIRDAPTQTVAGQVLTPTGAPARKNTSLLLYTARTDSGASADGCSRDGEGFDLLAPAPYSQAFTNDEGYFQFTLPPGKYCYRTRDEGRPLSDYRPFEVGDKPVYLNVQASPSASLSVLIQDERGNPMPGKIMLVGKHDYRGDLQKRFYLYDLQAGEPWRTSDMVPDDPNDPSTREYLEAIAYASADGIARLNARPGTYDVYASRGMEYELVRSKDVTLKPGQPAQLAVTLNRAIDTTGYLNGDFHMHARGSIDSGLSFDDRVISIAAEGLETVVSSDHNHVSDYLPYIARNGLRPWLNSVVGVELTTFEFGHFNAFPMNYDVGSINGGAVPWQSLPPQQIFDELRKHGTISPEETIIQVNHPRDTIMGYFSQYNVDPFTSEATLTFQDPSVTGVDKIMATISTPSGPSFMRDCRSEGESCRGTEKFESTLSWDFDAIEVFNGKHLELLKHYRVPYPASVGGADGWPQHAVDQIIDTTCADEFGAELTQFCTDNTIPAADCEAPLADHPTSAWCSFDTQALFARYPQGSVLCDGDTVAFPGGLDDWYNTLNYPRTFIRGDATPAPAEPVYKRYTATGNSDSHTAGVPNFTQPGSPRNFFYVGYDDPTKFKPADLVKAMTQHRNIISNGPFAFMKIGEASIGDEIAIANPRVDVEVVVRAAKWVGASRFRIIKNGEAAVVDDDATPTVHEFQLDEGGEYRTTVSLTVDKDSWLVLEVEGDNSLFPVYTPQEIPEVNFEAAIGSIAGTLGFGGGVDGLAPETTFPLTPFAFTNPIWLVYDRPGDSDGAFTPPAPSAPSCSAGALQLSEIVQADDDAPLQPMAPAQPRRLRRLDTAKLPASLKANDHHGHEALERQPGEYRDLRTRFKNWHTH